MRAATHMGGAWGDWFELLMRTAVRKNEAAEARARELELDIALPVWAIPPERFKSDAQHIVPLTPATAELLRRRKAELTDREEWDFLFSVRQGERPIGAFSKAKVAFDKLMSEELDRPVDPWRVHDVRRTVRTHLAAMQVPDNIAELVLGHGEKDPVKRTYNLFKYQREIRDALERWDQRLDEIVRVDPSKVVQLGGVS
jgi:integrase